MIEIGSRVEAGQRFIIMKGVFLKQFYPSNAGQPQPLDRYMNKLLIPINYQKL